MDAPRPFRIAVPDETLDRIRARVADYRWHEMPDDGGWAYGANLDYMKELCAYWVEEFDWREQEAALNCFAHFVAPVDGIDIHFIHEPGSGPAPTPIVISHGWAGLGGRVPRDHRAARPIPNASAGTRRTPSTW